MVASDGSVWLAICFFVLLHGYGVAGEDVGTMAVTNIGIIVDPSTRIGKEQIVGMKIAAEDFNNKSHNSKVELHLRRSSISNPLQAANSVIELIKAKRIVAIIIGTDNSEEVALLEEIANKYQVLVLSLSAPLVTSPSLVKTDSYFVQMTNNYTAQISCIASLVKNFGWTQVIAVYEDGGYGTTTSSMLDILSQELQDIGSKIEYSLALPPLAYVPNLKELIDEELVKVFSLQSRIFVILHSSLPTAIQLFKEAKEMGLVGRETAWIVTDSIASLLDAVNYSTKSYMEGALGVKAYYDDKTEDFMAFRRKFLLKFLTQYPDEEDFHPGIHASRAYDAITIIGKAFQREVLQRNNISPSTDALLQEISSSDFTGLSGKLSLKDGVLGEDVLLYRIVNVVGKGYKELDFWMPKFEFFEKFSDKNHGENSSVNLNKLKGMVNWPGDIKHVPKGWSMPSSAKPLKIGIPGNPPFDKFVLVQNDAYLNKTTYTGFCIDVFLEVVKIIEQSYGLPYEFEVFNGTYDELVYNVYDKTYDAAVGDITIMANRSKLVEFTQPYTKSGLSMIVPLKSKESQKALMFMKPFSWQLWLVALGSMFYIIFIVWWVECRLTNNADFEGCLTTQLNAALWFTVSSIFFAQRENIMSNLTRATVGIWLFVVFVLTSSYTANLTSVITVPFLEPSKVKDADWLIKTNSTVGCDGGAVWDYLVNVKNLSPKNIKNVSSQYDYQGLFDSGSITAAFFELPYQELLTSKYCKSFTFTKETYGFGAHSFVFQKGSPIVDDVSRAILQISENGVLKELQDKWFPISSDCSTSLNDHEVESLKLEDFSILYFIYGAVSGICLLSSLVKMIRKYGAAIALTSRSRSFLNWMIRFAPLFGGNHRSSQVVPVHFSSSPQTDDVNMGLELQTANLGYITTRN